MRSLLDAVGSFARAVGLEYATSGSMLRVVLLPVLERLGDPCPAVAAAAGVAVGSICLHCRYSGLADLVAHNIDYIVDGLCAQLRSIEQHPRCGPVDAPRAWHLQLMLQKINGAKAEGGICMDFGSSRKMLSIWTMHAASGLSITWRLQAPTRNSMSMTTNSSLDQCSGDTQGALPVCCASPQVWSGARPAAIAGRARASGGPWPGHHHKKEAAGSHRGLPSCFEGDCQRCRAGSRRVWIPRQQPLHDCLLFCQLLRSLIPWPLASFNRLIIEELASRLAI